MQNKIVQFITSRATPLSLATEQVNEMPASTLNEDNAQLSRVLEQVELLR